MTALTRIPANLAPAVLALAFCAALAALRVPPEVGAVVVVIAAVLAAAAVWALVDLPRFVLVAVLGLMILPATLLRPGGAQVSAADLLLLLALGAWLVRSSTGAAQAPWITGNRLFVPGLLFVAVNAASLAWSDDPSATIKFIVQVTEIVVVIPLVFASLPRSVDDARRGLLALVGATFVLAVVTLVYFLPRAITGDVTAQYLPGGLHKNAIGTFLGAGLVVAYSFWITERRSGVRRMLAVVAFVDLVALFGSASRGSLAGAFIAVAAVSLLLRRGRLLTLASVAVVTALFFAVIDPGPTAAELARGGYESSAVRTVSFDRAITKIGDRPLLGTGGGTYFDYLPEFQIGLADPNNLFLLTAAELGIAGILALVFLLYRFSRLFLAARRLPGPAAVPAVAAGAVVLSGLVHFQVDSTWTRGTASLAFASMGLMLAVGRLTPAGSPRDAIRAASGLTPGGPARGVATDARATGADTVATVAPTASRPSATVVSDVPAAAGDRTHHHEPLRVLHVVTSDAYAGIERHVLRLARELRALGCDAELACPPSALRLRAEAAAAGIPVRPSADGARRPWISRVARQLAAQPADVVHLHDGRAAVAGLLLARLGQPLVVRTQHFTHPASVGRRGLRREASLALHRTLNRRLDGYVAVSRSVADAADERRETGDAAVVVIAPGIELPDEAAVARAQGAREGLPQPVVAFVGRLEAEKHVDVLLHAIPRVLGRLPGCRFVIAGAGGQEAALRELSGRLGVEAAVTWTGEVTDPGAVFEGAHLYVNPSPSEGFGLATIEAMAFALPVVAADSGGSAEIVADTETGLLVAGGNADAMAAAIVALAGDRPRAAQLGEEARRRTLPRYGIERTAQATLAFYRRLSEADRA